jgi:hypothetical protein
MPCKRAASVSRRQHAKLDRVFDNPPYAMDGTTVDGEVVRRAIGTLFAPAGGIVSPGDLPVTQQATPNMSVQVGAGQIWVPGTSTSTQGPYYARNSGPVTLAIAASNPSNPRVDTIIAQVQDAAYAGATKQIIPAVVTGTPTAGVSVPPTTAAQAATDGAGAVPVSSYVLAYVLVPASATSIVTADIANVAAVAGLGYGTWVPLTLASGWTATSGYPAPSARLQGDTVLLKGVATNGTGGASLAPGTVPIGHPSYTVYRNAMTGTALFGPSTSTTLVTIAPTGVIGCGSIPNGDLLLFEQLSYTLS